MVESNFLLTLPDGLGNLFWRRISLQDLDVVESMICDQFVKYSPLCVALGVTREEAFDRYIPLCKVLMADGNSICAYEPNAGKVCGICINSGPHTVQKPTNNGADDVKVNEKLTKISRVLGFICDGPENALATRAGDDKFMRCGILIVHEGYARMGIGEALFDKSWEIAKEEGCKFAFATCSSVFATNIFKKHGGETLREVVYSKYTDPISGEKVFENCPEPHKIGTLMCKEL